MKNTINKIVDNCENQLAILERNKSDAIFDKNEERLDALSVKIDRYIFMRDRLKFLKTTLSK